MLTGYVVLTYEFGMEGKRWTAYCKELGTATFGRSLKEAEERLREAVCLHLNTLEDLGERERFFKEHNIKFYEVRPKTVKVSVPTKKDVFIHSDVQKVPALSACNA